MNQGAPLQRPFTSRIVLRGISPPITTALSHGAAASCSVVHVRRTNGTLCAVRIVVSGFCPSLDNDLFETLAARYVERYVEAASRGADNMDFSAPPGDEADWMFIENDRMKGGESNYFSNVHLGAIPAAALHCLRGRFCVGLPPVLNVIKVVKEQGGHTLIGKPNNSIQPRTVHEGATPHGPHCNPRARVHPPTGIF